MRLLFDEDFLRDFLLSCGQIKKVEAFGLVKPDFCPSFLNSVNADYLTQHVAYFQPCRECALDV